MIETYLHRFCDLRTDRGRNRYRAVTLHRAPHNPFLLLSVMDSIAQGVFLYFVTHHHNKGGNYGDQGQMLYNRALFQNS